MKKMETIFIKKEEIRSVVCNMCSHEIEKNSHGYLPEYLSIEKEWGYGSPFDGEKHNIDLCGNCYEKLLSMLKTPPSSDR